MDLIILGVIHGSIAWGWEIRNWQLNLLWSMIRHFSLNLSLLQWNFWFIRIFWVLVSLIHMQFVCIIMLPSSVIQMCLLSYLLHMNTGRYLHNWDLDAAANVLTLCICHLPENDPMWSEVARFASNCILSLYIIFKGHTVSRDFSPWFCFV